MPTNTDGRTRDSVARTDRGDERVAVRLTVTGTVQGVGFRPFVARTAAEQGLGGEVRNTDRGVEVRFEGPAAAVEAAVETVRSDPPRLASVESVQVTRTDPTGETAFDIVDSAGGGDRTALVPPDTAVCENCLSDIRDPDSRFHGYWASTCVDCGPRFAITEGLPYDRERTTLSSFPPCEDCRADLTDPTDRRYHAQTTTCPSCGPTLSLVTAGSEQATGAAALAVAADRLRAGETVGIKGAGGCHLACLATDHRAVARLRDNLGRPVKPFATMAPSLSRAREFATVSDREAKVLTGRRRPIVLLDREGPAWLDRVAPGLPTVGVMLPYSGLYHLLFEHLPDAPLVVTSANRPGEPMATSAGDLQRLSAVDAALVHDRPVANRCDDSVVRVVGGDRRVLRRSRGFVPESLPRRVVPADGTEVLAVGAATDVTVAATRGDEVVPSQHVGDVDSPATVAFHREATDHLLTLLDTDPAVVAHDAHPDLETTRVAEERPERAIAVQHHHAHAAGLLAEHDRRRAVVVAADGTGYGPDGVVRGGEVLDARLGTSERVGGLSEFPLPGGKAAIEEPARVAAGLLAASDPERGRSLLVETGTVDGPTEAAAVLDQAETGTNAPPTTSAGRFLDAVAALLGVCTERRYQGEPAMRLEAAARGGDPLPVDPPVRDRDGEYVLDAERAMARLAEATGEHSVADVAATAQRLLAAGLAETALAAAAGRGTDAVGFTGGLAYNAAVDRVFRHRVRETRHVYLGHDVVPPGDAGLAYGQAVAASARLAE